MEKLGVLIAIVFVALLFLARPSGVIFDEGTLKPGDRVGNFVVTSIGPLYPEISGVENIKIDFSGTIVLHGTYGEDENDGGGFLTDIKEYQQIPRQKNDSPDMSKSACISNYLKNPDVALGEKVVVTAKEYEYAAYPAGGCRNRFNQVTIEKL